MPLTLRACRHVHVRVSMVEILRGMPACHVWVLRRLQRGSAGGRVAGWQGQTPAHLSLSSHGVRLRNQRLNKHAHFLKSLLRIAGEGRHTFLDGSYCEGSWVAGERSAGVFVAGDRSWEYRGQWRGLERHGQGTLFQKGLSKYTGDYWHIRGTCLKGHRCTPYIVGTEHRRHWNACVRLSTERPLSLHTCTL